MKSGLSTFNPIHQTKLERGGQPLSVMMATLSFTGTLKSITSTILMARNMISCRGSAGHLIRCGDAYLYARGLSLPIGLAQTRDAPTDVGAYQSEGVRAIRD